MDDGDREERRGGAYGECCVLGSKDWGEKGGGEEEEEEEGEEGEKGFHRGSVIGYLCGRMRKSRLMCCGMIDA